MQMDELIPAGLLGLTRHAVDDIPIGFANYGLRAARIRLVASGRKVPQRFAKLHPAGVAGYLIPCLLEYFGGQLLVAEHRIAVVTPHAPLQHAV
jgi:mannitol-specific phosphotransferase system IIBC component